MSLVTFSASSEASVPEGWRGPWPSACPSWWCIFYLHLYFYFLSKLVMYFLIFIWICILFLSKLVMYFLSASVFVFSFSFFLWPVQVGDVRPLLAPIIQKRRRLQRLPTALIAPHTLRCSAESSGVTCGWGGVSQEAEVLLDTWTVGAQIRVKGGAGVESFLHLLDVCLVVGYLYCKILLQDVCLIIGYLYRKLLLYDGCLVVRYL